MWTLGGYLFRVETLRGWIANHPKAPKRDPSYPAGQLRRLMKAWIKDAKAPDCIFVHAIDLLVDGKAEWHVMLVVQVRDDRHATPLHFTQFAHQFERTQEVEDWLRLHGLPASEANFGTVIDPYTPCIREGAMTTVAFNPPMQRQDQVVPFISAA
jgi:hypothetical protein